MQFGRRVCPIPPARRSGWPARTVPVRAGLSVSVSECPISRRRCRGHHHKSGDSAVPTRRDRLVCGCRSGDSAQKACPKGTRGVDVWGLHPRNRGSDEGVRRLRRREWRQSARRARHDPCADRPERRRQDHLLQPADQVPAADPRPHHLQGRRTSPRWRRPTSRGSAWCARSRSRRCSRISPCWRTCASRCSASAAARSTSGARRACSTSYNERALALIDDVGLPSFVDITAVELPYGRKRALEIATTLALDPEMLLLDEPTAGMGHEDIDRIAALIKTRRRRPHRADGRAQSQRSSSNLCRPHHRADARPHAGRRRLRDGVEQSGGARGLYGDRPCLMCRAARCSRSKDLQAWYGESHILHGVELRRAPGRGGDAARPQRRRQDHDAEVDHGHRRQAHAAR